MQRFIGLNTFRESMNLLGKERTPFLFLIDFEMERPILVNLKQIEENDFLFFINGITNTNRNKEISCNFVIEKNPLSFAEYSEAFQYVQNSLKKGYSYCTNLTGRTPVTLNVSLIDIFYNTNAKYKVWYRNEFVCFSPETFITIKDGIITACPMKGTIDASIPGAAEIIINNIKEKAEHDTIVDLLRNDLSMISENVKVANYRYIEKIFSKDKELLQVSTAITGELNYDYYSKFGDILIKLLPAGSVSGAPKKATLDIIKKAEKIPRGYYTGIVGLFDGEKLDCGVMIRFIENINGNYFFRSGGGITTMSNVNDEYQELIDKIYVPIN